MKTETNKKTEQIDDRKKEELRGLLLKEGKGPEEGRRIFQIIESNMKLFHDSFFKPLTEKELDPDFLFSVSFHPDQTPFGFFLVVCLSDRFVLVSALSC